MDSMKIYRKQQWERFSAQIDIRRLVYSVLRLQFNTRVKWQRRSAVVRGGPIININAVGVQLRMCRTAINNRQHMVEGDVYTSHNNLLNYIHWERLLFGLAHELAGQRERMCLRLRCQKPKQAATKWRRFSMRKLVKWKIWGGEIDCWTMSSLFYSIYS